MPEPTKRVNIVPYVSARRRHNRDLAIALAAAGICVFPSAEKTPCAPAWQRLDVDVSDDERAAIIEDYRAKHNGREPAFVGCTKDAARVRGMWRTFPDAVPSVSCGPSGLLVLDADSKKSGPAQLRSWFAGNGGWPADAPATLTRSGGDHLFFRNAARLGSGAGAFKDLGVDVRGVGGQVVAPGAIREDGTRYVTADGAPDLLETFKAGAIPSLPEAVAAHIAAAPKSRASNISSIDEAREIARLKSEPWPSFETVTRDELDGFDLTTLAAKDAEFRQLWESPGPDHSDNRYNLAKCLRREFGAAVSVLDFAAILSAYEGAGAFVGDATPGADGGDYDYRAIAREFLRSGGSRPIVDGSAFGAVDEDDCVNDNETPTKSTKPLFIYADDAARDWAPVEFLIDGWLPKKGFGFMFGESRAMKSFGVVDMASHLVNGLKSGEDEAATLADTQDAATASHEPATPHIPEPIELLKEVAAAAGGWFTPAQIAPAYNERAKPLQRELKKAGVDRKMTLGERTIRELTTDLVASGFLIRNGKDGPAARVGVKSQVRHLVPWQVK